LGGNKLKFNNAVITCIHYELTPGKLHIAFFQTVIKENTVI